MKKALTLSVIIPAYNEEGYLDRCLQSLASQTTLPYEVIVVDNNSTDRTAEIADRYPFVTLVHEQAQGLYYARQTGMHVASGDVLCRIDADTVVDPGWIESISNAFQDKSVDALTGPVGYHDFVLPQTSQWLEDKLLKLALKIRYNFLFGCNMAVRRSVWEHVSPYLCDENYLMEDIDITTHLLDQGYKSYYSSDMGVLVSTRRAADSPLSFYRYIKGHSRTMKHHGLSPLGSYYAEVAFFVAYILFKPLLMLYDPESRRFSLRNLFAPSRARPDPIAIQGDTSLGQARNN